MSNNKQTAIDIFKEKLIDIFEDYHDGIITLDEYIEQINKETQQAKEMEKEQMKDCMSAAFLDGLRSGDENYKAPYEDWEQYYNETYGGNK
jgi:hypothetical protein